MDKKRLLHSIEWVVAVVALVYLVWRLATYDDYASLWVALQGMGWPQWTALVACVALMPVNMALEAWRWVTLMNGGPTPNPSLKGGERNPLMSFGEAQRQVYYSKLAGLVTPWRLGEYPARALLAEQESQEPRVKSQETWSRVLSMGAVGSATMTMAIVGAGLVALAFSPEVQQLLGNSYLYAVAAVALVLAIGLYFAPQALKKWAEMNSQLLWISLGQSFVRLACWCIQLALVLWALGAIDLQPSLAQPSTLNLLIYYLLVTITPNVPVVEVGVRGAWAIFLFGTANAALAGVLLWAINTLLPCLVWLFWRKR